MFEGISSAVLLIFGIVLLLTLILVTLIVLVIHSGLFTSIEDVGTGKPPIGKIVIAYKFQRGPYNQAGQIFTEAATIESQNKAIGIYYDDPCMVESSQLRYVVGSILSEGSSPVSEDMVKRFTDNDYKIVHLPEVTYVVKTSFPHITTLSILIAGFKAYPMLKEYIEERKLQAYPFIEYYDGKTIHFMAPLSKQDEFFVPECEQEDAGDKADAEYDSTTFNTSQSSVGKSHLSQDITQTPVGDEPAQDSQEAEQGDMTLGNIGTVADEKDPNDNNGGSDKDEEAVASNDDQGSEGSSSSFEVLKSEQAESID